MTFGAPEWFWALLLIPALIALFVYAEHRGLKRLEIFVSGRLLPQLAGTVNRPRRILKFALQLLGLALAIVSLAQPRWGYVFQDVKRKGLDVIIAVDTSRSMLSNDVQPNRLERVKLAAQDFINGLEGDRVGVIAFAGRAFLQAPLTIDYDAVAEAINDLNTKTIPEGGTNIASAISLAIQSFGKSAVGNRALILFTDGEELSGDAVRAARDAAEAGVRIFTVGVGTPQGSLIPVTGEDGQTTFVKDDAGQVVKSKLDEKRLKEIAEVTGGFYLHLENGPRTMQQIRDEGLAKMQAAEMDVRLSRRPIERYQWPLSVALVALTLAFLIPERKSAAGWIRRSKQTREKSRAAMPAKPALATVALLLCFASLASGAAPGINAYREGKYEDAYAQFEQSLKSHPGSRAEDRLQFDLGAAAYKLKDYGRALESFSQALLSKDAQLQAKSHYNLGNTLYQRGETQKNEDKKLSDWANALDHYQQALKVEPQNKEAKDNYEYVKKKIEELKNKEQQQQQPSPSPSRNNEKQNQQQQQQQQGQGQDKQQQKQQQSQSQSNSQNKQQQQQQNQNEQSRAGNQPQDSKQSAAQTAPTPSPTEQTQSQRQPSEGAESSPSPGQASTPAAPDAGQNASAQSSPTPGENRGEEPSAAPEETPRKKFAGEIKGAGNANQQKPPDKKAEMAEAEAEKEGQMSERQALALLESMKDEEARVRLDERRIQRHVYKDW